MSVELVSPHVMNWATSRTSQFNQVGSDQKIESNLIHVRLYCCQLIDEKVQSGQGNTKIMQFHHKPYNSTDWYLVVFLKETSEFKSHFSPYYQIINSYMWHLLEIKGEKKRHKELVYHVAGISRKFLAQWQINDLMSIGKRLSPLFLSRVGILFVFVLLEYVLVLCAPPRSSFGFFTYLCLLGC